MSQKCCLAFLFIHLLFLLQVKYCLELGISADLASLLFIFLGLSSCVARIAAGRLCDVRWINAIFIYQFGALLVGFSTLVLPVVRSYKGIAVFAVLYGLGDGIFITTMNSLLMFTVDEKRRATALGLGSTLLSVGIVTGPPLAGEQASAILLIAGVLKMFYHFYGLRQLKFKLINQDSRRMKNYTVLPKPSQKEYQILKL